VICLKYQVPNSTVTKAEKERANSRLAVCTSGTPKKENKNTKTQPPSKTLRQETSKTKRKHLLEKPDKERLAHNTPAEDLERLAHNTPAEDLNPLPKHPTGTRTRQVAPPTHIRSRG